MTLYKFSAEKLSRNMKGVMSAQGTAVLRWYRSVNVN